MAQNSVYIGNIAWGTTEQQIGDTFANFGDVTGVKICTDDTGRSRGFGFVDFQDGSVVPGVITQMTGYNLNGRKLKVGHATGPNKGQGNFQNNMQQQSEPQYNNQQQYGHQQAPQQQYGQQQQHHQQQQHQQQQHVSMQQQQQQY